MICTKTAAIVAAATVTLVGSCELARSTVLSPTDFIIAIDTDPASSSSNYPGGEAPVPAPAKFRYFVPGF